ncbi:sulfide dehydrogenase [Thermus albus]|uniref:sulfide dehydrogenase n=1 Tax=Thermus albus TaxID=2908146 RepID=UPI001FAAEF98|nr:sulfide dehydrogenase [Thermus albus]
MKKKLVALVLLLGLGFVAAEVPGVVRGQWTQGDLGTILQPAPAAAGEGSTINIGPLPLYTAELADGEGKELVMAYCSICHSVTYIPMQPPLANWKPTMDKMLKTYGGEKFIPAEAAEKILAYLQAHYTPETRKQ